MMPQNKTAQIDRVQDRRRGAFTLIELLIVIALTGLLLTLIVGPLIQGMNLTNRARAYAEAQDATRFGIERLKRELSQASFVFDNSTTPIVLPLSDNVNDNRGQAYPNVYSAQPGNPQPSVLYAKLDFIPSATAGEGAGTVVDPTTGKPLGGTPLVLPIAPGQRYVRYFLGLREPYKKDAAGNWTAKNYYSNPYEFRRSDSSLNAFILWRAEYDPRDPNLINPSANAYAFDGAGLHDPDFFYNASTAPNGRRYCENWRAVAQPVLTAANLDLIAWRKNQTKQIVAGAPFQILLNLTPSAQTGETAAPSFLSSTMGEQGNAIPTQYSTQFGLWTYPFTITVYRGAAQGRPGSANYGQIRFVVEQKQDPSKPNDPQVYPAVTLLNASGNSILPSATNPYYWLFDNNTGKLFIHTAKLTFQVDPARGRVETVFAPLATDNSGVPLYYPAGSTTPVALTPANTIFTGNVGTLVTTAYRQDTYRGSFVSTSDGTTITNAGLISTTLDQTLYYNGNAVYRSPFRVFGFDPLQGAVNTNPTAWRSIIIAPGSERVQGPDVNLTKDATNTVKLTDYFRIPAVGSIQKSNATAKVSATESVFVRTEAPNYLLDTAGEDKYTAPLLKFDEDGGTPESAAGLPAGKTIGVAELRVSYLWQNNFARDSSGHPLNTFGEFIGSANNVSGGVGSRHTAFATGNDYRPEADVFKVDYSTRSLINVLLGARVFDSSTGTPQTAQVTNRITVGNIAR